MGYEKGKVTGMRFTDYFPLGSIVVIGLTEAAHLAAIFTGRSFSDCVKLFVILVAAALLAALAFGLLHGKRKGSAKAAAHLPRIGTDCYALSAYTVFGVLVLVQLGIILSGEAISIQGDMTVETVNSFLETDAFYQVNPLTGQAYSAGLPFRLKILCLPTLYGALSRLLFMPVRQVVWVLVPLLTLITAYFVYAGLAKTLFPESAAKRGIFLATAALIFLVSDYRYGMDGFGLLHSGFRGTSIRALILIPYTFDLCMRKRWKTVLLCILAEACIVWTLYGLGACALIAVGMLLTQKGVAIVKNRKGREEAPICRNS